MECPKWKEVVERQRLIKAFLRRLEKAKNCWNDGEECLSDVRSLLEDGSPGEVRISLNFRRRVESLILGAYTVNSQVSRLTRPLVGESVERKSMRMVRRVIDFVRATARRRAPVINTLLRLAKAESNSVASGDSEGVQLIQQD